MTAAGSRPPLFTRPFVALAIVDLAYFTAAGLEIPILPLFASGPLGANEVGVGGGLRRVQCHGAAPASDRRSNR